MKRLIDADALLCRFGELADKHKPDGDLLLFDSVVDEIQNATTVDAVVLPCKIGDFVWAIRNYHSVPHPQQGKVSEIASTVDAVPVVHGRWKYFHKQNKAVCLNCSFERDLDVNFGKAVSCPNCGAKMDGGNEDG